MVDTGWLLFGASLVSAIAAMTWSFLMASKVAAPRAAAKSKLLLVNILTGATPEDKAILEEVRGSLVRPEIEAALEKFEMPDYDLAPLEAKLDAMFAAIPDEISTHIEMHMKSMQAAEAKRLQALLGEMDLEGVAAEKRQEIVERMSTKQKAAVRLMTMKIPKAVKERNPLAAAVFDEARVLVGQALIEGEDNVQYETGAPARGGSFRPGYNP